MLTPSHKAPVNPRLICIVVTGASTLILHRYNIVHGITFSVLYCIALTSHYFRLVNWLCCVGWHLSHADHSWCFNGELHCIESCVPFFIQSGLYQTHVLKLSALAALGPPNPDGSQFTIRCWRCEPCCVDRHYGVGYHSDAPIRQWCQLSLHCVKVLVEETLLWFNMGHPWVAYAMLRRPYDPDKIVHSVMWTITTTRLTVVLEERKKAMFWTFYAPNARHP